MIKITIIAPSSFGYIDFLINSLKLRENFEVNHINFSDFTYKYSSKSEKIKNSLNKIFRNKNIKESYKSERILESFSNADIQNYIIIVRPEKIELKTLKALKLLTNNLYAFYFDSISNFPKKIKIIPLFDKVFSFEKEDVEKYNLVFITNYIYDIDVQTNTKINQRVFNISSYDNRFESIKSIAAYLKKEQISYNFIVRKEKPQNDDLITMIPEYMSLKEVKKLILSSEIVLDIRKNNQKGLSFRVFEALGYEKKLITTNADVASYDFYNPNNILIININAIEIPKEFLDSKYDKISNNILYPYTLEGWIDKIITV